MVRMKMGTVMFIMIIVYVVPKSIVISRIQRDVQRTRNLSNAINNAH